MSEQSATLTELPIGGPAAPPRANGELVFSAPWQSRVFGVAATLAEAGGLAWADFQAALIVRVAGADARGDDTGLPDCYWTCWLEALGDVTVDAGHVDRDEWQARGTVLAARPAGHDHDHDHEH